MKLRQIAMVVAVLTAMLVSVTVMGCAADQRASRLKTAKETLASVVQTKVQHTQCAQGSANPLACDAEAMSLDQLVAAQCAILAAEKDTALPKVCAAKTASDTTTTSPGSVAAAAPVPPQRE